MMNHRNGLYSAYCQPSSIFRLNLAVDVVARKKKKKIDRVKNYLLLTLPLSIILSTIERDRASRTEPQTPFPFRPLAT